MIHIMLFLSLRHFCGFTMISFSYGWHESRQYSLKLNPNAVKYFCGFTCGSPIRLLVLVRLVLLFLFVGFQEMFEDINRQRENDGRILLGRDGVERLEVAQLEGGKMR